VLALRRFITHKLQLVLQPRIEWQNANSGEQELRVTVGNRIPLRGSDSRLLAYVKDTLTIYIRYIAGCSVMNIANLVTRRVKCGELVDYLSLNAISQ